MQSYISCLVQNPTEVGIGRQMERETYNFTYLSEFEPYMLWWQQINLNMSQKYFMLSVICLYSVIVYLTLKQFCFSLEPGSPLAREKLFPRVAKPFKESHRIYD